MKSIAMVVVLGLYSNSLLAVAVPDCWENPPGKLLFAPRQYVLTFKDGESITKEDLWVFLAKASRSNVFEEGKSPVVYETQKVMAVVVRARANREQAEGRLREIAAVPGVVKITCNTVSTLLKLEARP